MTKRLTTDDLLNASIISEPKLCRHCGSPFEARRNTKTYCSDKCRQYYNRDVQNADCSKAKSREQEEYYDRVRYALELFEQCPPEERDAWIQSYIDNPTTKRIVCNPDLLKHPSENIAKVCHRYVMSTYGVSIKSYY